MTRLLGNILSLALAFTPVSSWSYEIVTKSDGMSQCYSKAMIGMDSVINSRVGVLAEHALALSIKPGKLDSTETSYYREFLIVILDAYLWSQSPHDYAIKVFYDCAAQSPPLHNAGVDPNLGLTEP